MEKSCVNGGEIRRLEFKIVGCIDEGGYYEVVITEQSHYGDKFTPDGRQFFGEGGSRLVSSYHPYFSHVCPPRTFYVRGLHRESDLEVIKIPYEHFSTFVSLVMEYNRLYGEKVEKDTFLDIKDTFVHTIEDWWEKKIASINERIEALRNCTTIESARENKMQLLLELLKLPLSCEHCPNCLVQAEKHESFLGNLESCIDCPFGTEKGICRYENSTYNKLSWSLYQTIICVVELYSKRVEKEGRWKKED